MLPYQRSYGDLVKDLLNTLIHVDLRPVYSTAVRMAKYSTTIVDTIYDYGLHFAIRVEVSYWGSMTKDNSNEDAQ